MLKTMTVRATIAAILAGLSMSAHAIADSPKTVDIPAGDLRQALLMVSEQFGTDLVFSPEQIRGFKTGGAHGQLTTEQAVTKLLEGTPLELRTDPSGAILIAPPAAKEAPQASTHTERPKSFWSRLAQASSPSQGEDRGEVTTREDRIQETGAQRAETPAQSQKVTELEEIVVVGSRLGARQSAQPLIVLDRDVLDRSGAGSVAQALNSMPEVSVSSTGTFGQANFGATTVQLRGLPVGTTLVLINGRRIGSSGIQGRDGYFDLSTIPVSMVERVEVLATGSSAVYGGDALGGVVNIVLKKEVDGFDSGIRYGESTGYDEVNGNLGWGHKWSRGSFSIFGSYGRNGELQGLERAITADQDHRSYGSADRRVLVGNPGTVYSRTTANLPGLNSRFAAIPVGSTGVGLTPQSFAATAGQQNRTSSFAYNAYLRPEERYSAFVYGTFELTSAVELFTEIAYARSDVDQGGFFPALMNGQAGTFVAPATNPFNPFGVPVGVEFLFEERQRLIYEQDFRRAVAGAKGSIGSLRWELTGAATEVKQEQVSTNILNSAAVSAALASTNPATALNVFQDGPGGSPELIASLLQSVEQNHSSDMRSISGYASGPLMELASGSVDLLIGAEYERNALDIASLGLNEASRDAYASFGEIKIPLIAGRSADVASMLELSGAVRYDRYSDFGNRTSAGAGIVLRPLPDFLLRASYSSAFKPPLLFQLYSDVRSRTATITDPEVGQTYITNVVFGANSNLEPQTGTSNTVGFEFTPRQIPDLSFSVTHWDISLKDGITQPALQSVVENPNYYPGRVTRDPVTGRVSLLDITFVNFGSIDESGVDLSVDWRQRVGNSQLSALLSTTYTYRYDVVAVAGAPETDSVSVASTSGFAPKWKGTARLGWDYGTFLQTTHVARYVGEYRDYAALADGSFQTLGDVWYYDVSARFDLSQLIPSSWTSVSRPYVTLGALNLLDRKPDFSTFNSGVGYDPAQYDLRGRFVYAKLGLQF